MNCYLSEMFEYFKAEGFKNVNINIKNIGNIL